MQHIGNHMKISEAGARVIGNYNNVTGPGCTVTGNYNKVYGSGSTVCGNYNKVSSDGAVVNGNYNDVSGTGSIVKGNYNTVSGSGSSVKGINNIVPRDESTNKDRDRSGNSRGGTQPSVVHVSMDKNSVMHIDGFPGFENVTIRCGQLNTGGARFLGNVTFSDTPDLLNFGTINQIYKQAEPDTAARPPERRVE